MLLMTSAQRAAFNLPELPRRPAGLQCPHCPWCPPPRWRERVHPIDWYALYDEHQRVMHRPHASGCRCVRCVRGE